MTVPARLHSIEIPTLPPQQLEAEQSVLGSVLLDNQAMLIAAEQLQPEMFYPTAHQEIFTAMLALSASSEPVDSITLADALRRRNKLEVVGGSSYLAELVHTVATAANIKHHVALVHDAAWRRQIIRTGHALIAQGHDLTLAADAVVDEAEQTIFQLAAGHLGGTVRGIPQVMTETLDLVDRMVKRGKTMSGVASGFTYLDALTAGWQDGDLVIVAARPSMGKTSFALTIAAHAAIDLNIPVGVFSLEMGRVQVGLRLLALRANVDVHGLSTGRGLRTTEWQYLAHAAQEISQSPMLIDDSGHLSVMQLRAKARRMKAEKKIGLLVVDYLQLMDGPEGDSHQQKMANISRSLKLLAKELEIPVIALSQLNRSCENRHDNRPMLADLRDSGAIEQDADLVLFIYRDEVYNPDSVDRGLAEILVRKHRNGPIGEVKLAFKQECATFRNAEDL